MLAERQAFLDRLNSLSGSTLVLDEEQVSDLIEDLSLRFALYEKELIDKINFLTEALGVITVCEGAPLARDVAVETLREAEYRWEG